MFPLNNKLMVCFEEDKVQMLKIFQLCIRYLFLLAYRLWTCISYLVLKQAKTVSILFQISIYHLVMPNVLYQLSTLTRF